MKRAVFARFRSSATADRALAALRQDSSCGSLRIRAHRHAAGTGLRQEVQESNGFVETDLRHGIVVGLVTGVASGAILGALLFAVVLDTTLSAWTGAAIGALLGGIVGVLMAGLCGMGLTDRRLQQLAKGLDDDEVIVTIETADRGAVPRIRDVVTRHGGRVAEKSAV